MLTNAHALKYPSTRFVQFAAQARQAAVSKAIGNRILQHRREFGLLHSAVARETLGQHKIKDWLPFNIAAPEDVSLELSASSGSNRAKKKPDRSTANPSIQLSQQNEKKSSKADKTALPSKNGSSTATQQDAFPGINGPSGTYTLDKILEKIGPREVLLPVWSHDGRKLPEYKLETLPAARRKVPVRQQKYGLASVPGGKHPKETHFHRGSSNDYIISRLNQAYAHLDAGEAVECQIHHSMKKDIPRDDEAVRRLVDECAHFRPDVIIKAMPEGSELWLEPQTNGRKYGFVIAPPGLTARISRQSITRAFTNRQQLQVEMNVDPQTDSSYLTDLKLDFQGRPINKKLLERFEWFKKNKPTVYKGRVLDETGTWSWVPELESRAARRQLRREKEQKAREVRMPLKAGTAKKNRLKAQKKERRGSNLPSSSEAAGFTSVFRILS
ncbi:MAG: hypothetical protein M1821_007155 [Bathelium mastoideum]|nr:MAG: hypothetical protein M1821_007155 [Bathelium mastoideum]